MLANKLTLAQCLLAALFAWLLPLLLQQLSTRKLLLGGFLWHVPRIVKPWLLLRFVVMVGWDIAVANFEVAVQILQPNRRLRPTFVEMPLVVQDEFVIALLMSVITLTPGTLAAQLSGDRRNLLIHVLHTNDPAALIEQLQQRYERPLQKIFAS
jgi:multicomponent K+:H+ antiporter subunit E